MKRTLLFWNNNLSINLIKSSASIFTRVLIVIFSIFFFENLLLSQQEDSLIPAQFIYPGDELEKFIKDNMVRPYGCQQYGINADVEVSFTVDTLGKIVKPELVSFIPSVHHYNAHSYDYYSKNYANALRNARSIEGLKVPVSSEKQDSDSVNKMNKEQIRELWKVTDTCENLDSAFVCEAFRILKFSNGLWIPAKQNGNSVSFKSTLTIHFISSNYYYDESRKTYHEPMSKQEWLMNRNVGWNTIYGQDYGADNPIKYHNLGVEKLIEKKYLLAHKYFFTALTLDKSYADAWYNLGVTNHLIQNHTEACQCWVKAWKLGIEDAKKNLDDYCK